MRSGFEGASVFVLSCEDATLGTVGVVVRASSRLWLVGTESEVVSEWIAYPHRSRLIMHDDASTRAAITRGRC